MRNAKPQPFRATHNLFARSVFLYQTFRKIKLHILSVNAYTEHRSRKTNRVMSREMRRPTQKRENQNEPKRRAKRKDREYQHKPCARAYTHTHAMAYEDRTLKHFVSIFPIAAQLEFR